MCTSKTKQKILDAAISLFHTKGYAGTSVREIAKKADVNAANISYYFDGKIGLLETLVTSFLEKYLSIVEQAYLEKDSKTAKECLVKMSRNIMVYQKEYHLLARFVHRETTFDTVLIREIMTTYLMKEKYYFKTILEMGMDKNEFRNLPIPYVIIQLKGMLSMPYLQPQYMSEVLHIQINEMYFIEQYMKELEKWINQTLSSQITRTKIIPTMTIAPTV